VDQHGTKTSLLSGHTLGLGAMVSFWAWIHQGFCRRSSCSTENQLQCSSQTFLYLPVFHLWVRGLKSLKQHSTCSHSHVPASFQPEPSWDPSQHHQEPCSKHSRGFRRPV